MKRISIAVIILALLVPIRLSFRLSPEASDKAQAIAHSIAQKANREIHQARKMLRVRSDALRQAIPDDVTAAKNVIDNTIRNAASALKKTLKPAGESVHVSGVDESKAFDLRRGIDLVIAAALALLLIAPKPRRAHAGP